jgi:hypothetical protein
VPIFIDRGAPVFLCSQRDMQALPETSVLFHSRRRPATLELSELLLQIPVEWDKQLEMLTEN